MVGAGEEFMVAAALYESKTKSQLLAKKAIICTYIEKHELVFCTLLSFLCPTRSNVCTLSKQSCSLKKVKNWICYEKKLPKKNCLGIHLSALFATILS